MVVTGPATVGSDLTQTAGSPRPLGLSQVTCAYASRLQAVIVTALPAGGIQVGSNTFPDLTPH